MDYLSVSFISKRRLLQVLSDDEKRSIYDRYGEAGLKGAGIGTGVSSYSTKKINNDVHNDFYCSLLEFIFALLLSPHASLFFLSLFL